MGTDLHSHRVGADAAAAAVIHSNAFESCCSRVKVSFLAGFWVAAAGAAAVKL